MFQDFKLDSKPEMSGRAEKAGLGPSWLCCYDAGFSAQSGLLGKVPSTEGPLTLSSSS